MLYVKLPYQINSYSILIVNIDDTISISNNKYPARLIVKHGLESHSTARLEVSCHVLILEFGQPEYSIFAYGIKVAEGSVRVQAHHSFSVSLENFIL
jgi:hypothetical protein